MTIPQRKSELLETESGEITYTVNTGEMRYKTGGTFQGLLVEAMLDGERIGYLTAGKIESGEYILDGVFVEESYRRQGIATEMLRKAHNVVSMIPYSLTENQVYRSEAGRKLIQNEYKLLKSAGPLLALPELAAGAEALAGGAEAAGVAGEAADSAGPGIGKYLTRGVGMGSGNSQDKSNDQSSGSSDQSQQSGPPTPANPMTGSFKTIAFYSPTPTVPMTIPSITPSTTAPTGGQSGQTFYHNTQSIPQDSRMVNKEMNGGDNDEDHPPSAPSATDPAGKSPVQPTRGFNNNENRGLQPISLEIQRPMTNAPTPAMPRGASVNTQDKLIELIIEDQNKRAAVIKKTTTWEPVEKTYEDDSIWD